MKYLTKKDYLTKTDDINKNFPTKNWKDNDVRWLYHKKAIEWIKELKPKTILEIGGLGVKLTDKSDTADYVKSGWSIDSEIQYQQDINEKWELNDYDMIVALRVLHHAKDFKFSFNELRKHCNYLILALPKEMKVPTYDDYQECLNSNIYLWKSK